MWTIKDVIEKADRSSKYNQVLLVGLSEREALIRYGKSSNGSSGSNEMIDLELCYPGPIGFGTQRVGLSAVDLIRAIRECGRKKGERDFIGVEYFGKSRDEMNSRELIVSDIFSRFDLCESKVKKALRSKTKKGRTVRLGIR